MLVLFLDSFNHRRNAMYTAFLESLTCYVLTEQDAQTMLQALLKKEKDYLNPNKWNDSVPPKIANRSLKMYSTPSAKRGENTHYVVLMLTWG